MLNRHWADVWKDGSYDSKDFMEVVFREMDNNEAPGYYRSVFQRIATLIQQQQLQHTTPPDSIKREQDIVKKEQQDLTNKKQPNNANDNNYKQLRLVCENETLKVQELKRRLEVVNLAHIDKTQALQALLQDRDHHLALATANSTNLTTLRQYEQYCKQKINQNECFLNKLRQSSMDITHTLETKVHSFEEQNNKLDHLTERATMGIRNLNKQIMEMHDEIDSAKDYIRIANTFLSLARTMGPLLENLPPDLRDAMVSFVSADASTNSSHNPHSLYESTIAHNPSVMNSPSRYSPQDKPNSPVAFPDDISYSPMDSPEGIFYSAVSSLQDSPENIFYSAVSSPQGPPYQ